MDEMLAYIARCRRLFLEYARIMTVDREAMTYKE